MDPITSAIVNAVMAGATTGLGKTAGTAVVDAYNGLKMLLQKKLGQDKKLLDAVHELEQDTSSDGRKMIVQEEVKKAGMDRDKEILAAASRLSDLLKEVQPKSDNKAVNTGSGAIIQGDGVAGSGQGGISIVGDVHGGINMPGSKDD